MKITDKHLYAWVIWQRQHYKNGKLDARKIKLLESIPGWTWDVIEDQWQRGYDYTKQYGVVTQTFKTPDGYRLGGWQTHQRKRCEDKDKRELLEKIPGWAWDMVDQKWDTAISLSMKHGRVAAKFATPDGYKLGQWQQLQRLNCHDKKRRKVLEKIPGWTWNDPKEDAWEEAFKLSKKYGAVSLPFKTPDGFDLAQWQKNQRKRCKIPEKRERLESIPGWTWSRSELKGFATTKTKARRK